jgi:hypothetical protein
MELIIYIFNIIIDMFIINQYSLFFYSLMPITLNMLHEHSELNHDINMDLLSQIEVINLSKFYNIFNHFKLLQVVVPPCLKLYFLFFYFIP